MMCEHRAPVVAGNDVTTIRRKSQWTRTALRRRPGFRQDAAMYVHATRVRTSDRSLGDAATLAEEMVGWLEQIEGFEGMVMLTGEDTVVGLTFWRSRELAERHHAARMEFVQRMTSVVNVEIEETVGYELTYARLGPGVRDLAG